METTIKALLESLKPDLKLLLITFSLLYFGYIFLPSTVEPIQLLQSYKIWVHLLGLVSITYLNCLVLSKLISIIKFKINMNSRKNYFHTLSREEKLILRKFIINQKKTVKLSVKDGEVNHLENLGFIYRTSTIGDHRMNFDFTMQPWAWNYLNSNKNFIGPESEFSRENDTPPIFRF